HPRPPGAKSATAPTCGKFPDGRPLALELYYSGRMTGVETGKPAPASRVWRRKLLEWLLVYALGLATLAFPVIALQAVTLSHLGWVSVLVGLYLVLLSAAVLRSLPYVVRALGLLIGLGSVALLGFMRVGFQSGPGIGAALIVVLSGLLLGRRGMLSAFA